MTYRFEIELELGRFEECEATAAEVLRVADEFDDQHLRSYTTWNRSIAASFLGDAEATIDLVRQTEKEASDWWAYASADFCASASEGLGRVGEIAMAFEYLERALADPQDGEPLIAMAEAVLEARAGDPERAEALLLAAPARRVDPRERWRITLFRALAAFRRDDRGAGALAARAFEEAARLGLAQLPLTKERSATEAVLGLAVETGQPAALALEGAALPLAVRVLGGFAVTRGGRPLPLAAGQGTQLVKLLAAHGGRVVTDRVVDTLWPDAEADSGRHRLRTLLNRVRADAGDLVVRDGDTLALAPGVAVDLERFESEARRALALGLSEPVLSSGARPLGDRPLPRRAAARGSLRGLDGATPRGRPPIDAAAARPVRRRGHGPGGPRRAPPHRRDDDRPRPLRRRALPAGRGGAHGPGSPGGRAHRRAARRSALAELGLTPSPHLITLEAEIVA